MHTYIVHTHIQHVNVGLAQLIVTHNLHGSLSQKQHLKGANFHKAKRNRSINTAPNVAT